MKCIVILQAFAATSSMLMAQIGSDPIRESEQLQRDILNDRKLSDQSLRISNLENANTELRYPTPEEVKVMQDQWLAANPLTFSGNMPKFEKRKIRVPLSNNAQIEQRLAAQDRIIQNLQNSQTRQMAPAAKAHPQKQHQPSRSDSGNKPNTKEIVGATPTIPNPNSVIMRKLSDGRIKAIIGGKAHEFVNQAEADAYIEKMKH